MRLILRAIGVLLLLPLAGAFLFAFVGGTGCDYDCSDQGKGVFILVLLCTPLAAAGVLALAAAGRKARGPRTPAARTPATRLARQGRRAVVIPVVLCALLLGGTAVSVVAGGIDKLTSPPRVNYIGDPDAGRRQADREGEFLLGVGGLLVLMATGTGGALWAAWRMRR
jgi:hypothetical protein